MQCGHIESTVDYEQQVDRAQSEGSDSGALAVVSAGNNSRDQLVAQNAMMLGFDSALKETVGARGHSARTSTDDLARAQVAAVLRGADRVRLPARSKLKKYKLSGRRAIACPSEGRDPKGILAMTQRASRYFGKNSSGLIRMDLPEGHVEVGDVKSLGVINPDR